MHAGAGTGSRRLLQRFGEARAPRGRVLRRRGNAQVGEFVAEIPGQQRRMVPHALADPAREERLRGEQLRVRIEITDGAIDDRAVRDGSKAAFARRAFQRPSGKPVDAAHVPAEERGHCLQPRLGDALHQRVEPAERVFVHRARLRLKRLPHEEEANDVQSQRLDARHVFGDLVEIESLPHVHRAAPRPIVDAEQKASHCARVGVYPENVLRLRSFQSRAQDDNGSVAGSG